MRIDSERAREIQITVVEGFQLLGSFDVRLREYAAQKLHKQGVHLVKARSQMHPGCLPARKSRQLPHKQGVPQGQMLLPATTLALQSPHH